MGPIKSSSRVTTIGRTGTCELWLMRTNFGSSTTHKGTKTESRRRMTRPRWISRRGHSSTIGRQVGGCKEHSGLRPRPCAGDGNGWGESLSHRRTRDVRLPILKLATAHRGGRPAISSEVGG
jgi:hypothetical protein